MNRDFLDLLVGPGEGGPQGLEAAVDWVRPEESLDRLDVDLLPLGPCQQTELKVLEPAKDVPPDLVSVAQEVADHVAVVCFARLEPDAALVQPAEA